MHLLLTVASCLAALSCAHAAPKPDRCKLLAAEAATDKGGWLSWNNVVGCLETFPLNEAIRQSTIETFSRTLEGEYAFTDMASVASQLDHGRWDLEDVDLRKALKSMKNKRYKNDKTFHDDLAFLLRQLGDAHTGYRSSCFHSHFSFYQPWAFDVVVDTRTGKQNVFLAEVAVPVVLGDVARDAFLERFRKAIHRDPRELIGWRVVKIDQRDPVDYIRKFSKTQVGLVKDKNQKFNIATSGSTVQRNGDVTKRVGPMSIWTNMESPSSAFRTLHLISPDGKRRITLLVPWIARSNREINFENSEEFWTNACLAKKPETLESLSKPAESLHEELNGDAVVVLSAGRFPNNTENAFGNGYPRLLKKGDFASFHMLDAETGVSALPTFTSNTSPSDPFGKVAQACREKLHDPDASANIGTGGPAGWRFYCFIQEIHEGLTLLKNSGAKRLILDWTNNGGGWGDLGTMFVAVMFPNITRQQATFRMTPFFSDLIAKAFEKDQNLTTPLTMYGPGNFVDLETETAPLPSDVQRLFLSSDSGHTEKWGKYASRYSERIEIVDGGAILDERQEHNVWNATGIPRPSEPMWDSKDVMLFTNGFCGSTCAHAARKLVDVVGVRSVVTGGLAGADPFPFSAFPGGNVVDLAQIFGDVAKLDMSDHPLAPQPFLQKVSLFRVNAGVGYSVRDDLPAEYAYKAADCRIDQNEKTIFPPFAWLAAAATFNNCPDADNVLVNQARQ